MAKSRQGKRLPVSALRRRCTPSSFKFRSTRQVGDPRRVIGQDRALDAIALAVGLGHSGYNLFALGPSGLGKHGVVARMIEPLAAQEPAPDDWCYVFNFADPKCPTPVRLPAGRGRAFVQAMEQLKEDMRRAINAAFESDSYRAQRGAIGKKLQVEHQAQLKVLRRKARKLNIGLLQDEEGITLVPLKDGEPLTPIQFSQLPERKQEAFQQTIAELQDELEGLMYKVPAVARREAKRLDELNHKVVLAAVTPLIKALAREYRDVPDVIDYLDGVRLDVGQYAQRFHPSNQERDAAIPAGMAAMVARMHMLDPLERYSANLIVDNSELKGAPIIHEDAPSFANLVGRIDYAAEMGALVTDFTQIKAGALHRANGGYLLLDAAKVLTSPGVWDLLKRALRSGRVAVRPFEHLFGAVNANTIEPGPIELDVKVILIGERWLYYRLAAFDPEFTDVFKIAADFAEDIEWNARNLQVYARLIARLARLNHLKPLNKAAVCQVVEHSARLCADQNKLTIRVESLADVLREADYYREQGGKRTIDAEHIRLAVAGQRRRESRIEEMMQKRIEQGTVMISTRGTAVGQINGLAVLQIGGYRFGKPSRITASTFLGKGHVMDIEREVHLGGSLHTKGVLILGGFLSHRFGQKRSLSVSARLVFEQSYGGIDGDSASSTELYALLSALANLPIKQGIGVTGSVNQWGEIQAIGGVNEKIEGFFDVCAAGRLTGDQGVLIPQANVRQLMLREDVIAAVRAKKFHVWAVSTIEEGIEILTGKPAGRANKRGKYPAGSVFGLVEQRLEDYASQEKRRGDADRRSGGKAKKATSKRKARRKTDNKKKP